MKQLGPLDSAFINLESNNTPQHIGGLGIYDPSTAADGFVRFKDVLANFDQRMQREPLFRTRLVTVPGDIDRPYWVEDKNFDVEFHIRHIALPQPGDWRQLWIQTARLHARSLDMARPLWEIYIIEGLDNIQDLPKGSFAVYTKMHHSLVDGAGGQSFMSVLHDLEPNPTTSIGAKPNTIMIDREPSGPELLARAMVNRTRNQFSLIKGGMDLTRNVVDYTRKVRNDEIPSPDIQAPRSRFNGPVGPHRVAEAAVFELNALKAIKNAAHVTLNDVVVSIIGGGLRKYLQLHGELPEEALVASMPLNMRTRRAETDENNQIGAMSAKIHTDVEDPAERLQRVNLSNSEAKAANELNPLVDALKVAGIFSPVFTKSVASAWANNNLSRFMPANVSTNISNVPGPNFPLFCAGAEMVRYHGLGLLTPSVGLFHLIYSSNGSVTLTFLADRQAMPDPETYRNCLVDSFSETYNALVKDGVNSVASESTSARKAKGGSKPAQSAIPAKKTVKRRAAKKRRTVQKVDLKTVLETA